MIPVAPARARIGPIAGASRWRELVTVGEQRSRRIDRVAPLGAAVTLRPVSDDLHVSAGVWIPADELSWTAVRAGGPGGQNVNKVATKVELRFRLRETRALDASVRQRLARLAGARVDTDGSLRIVCQETRNQARNLELARDKLADLIRGALVAPKPRRKTRKPARADRVRLDSKRRRSETKRDRRRVAE